MGFTNDLLITKEMIESGLDIDLLSFKLKNYEFRSNISFNNTIKLFFTDNVKDLNRVSNYDSHVNEFYDEKYRFTTDYLETTKELFLKLEVRLINEYKINPTFVNFLHIVRYYELNHIYLVNKTTIDKYVPFYPIYDNDEIIDCKDRDYDPEHRDRNRDRDYDPEHRDKDSERKKRIYRELRRKFTALGIYRGSKNDILICPENHEDLLSDIQYVDCCNCKKLYIEHLLENTLYHEVGHSIFLYYGDYLGLPLKRNNEEFKERQANYFASFASMGKNDELIYDMTFGQPSIYKEPMLYTDYAYQYSDFNRSDIKKLYVDDYKIKVKKHKPKAFVKGSITGSIALEAQEIVDRIHNKRLSKNDLMDLINPLDSKRLFNLGYPLLVLADSEYDTNKYYSFNTVPIVIFGKCFVFTNDWLYKSEPYLDQWIAKHPW